MQEGVRERELRQIRLEKLEKLKAKGIPVYPDRFDRTHSLQEASKLDEGERIRVAGRITRRSKMGGVIFGDLRDVQGKLQFALSKEDVGEDNFDTFQELVDIGDFMGCEGVLFRTKRGELTVQVERYQFLGKALRPLPEKWKGLQDRELCYRQRYLDLVMNASTRERFLVRSKVIRTIRRFLDDHQFEEVETPVLCPKPSGALATPFQTHHNALDIDVYLRIAPETYLKRLIVGGYDRIYEFARCFRNEGMDPTHLQDFTMLEYYCAYWNYEDNMDFTEKLVVHLLNELAEDLAKIRWLNQIDALKSAGKGKEAMKLFKQGYEVKNPLKVYLGEEEIDFTPPWPRISLRDLILQDTGIDVYQFDTVDKLRKEIKKKKIDIEDMDKMGKGKLVDQLYKKTSRPKLKNPTFIISHPIELSPLARKNDENSQIVDRFQLLVAGAEIVNAYSELVDPIDQRHRLEEQARLNQKGDEEAMVMDEDYLLAMEHGMPPISGWGMGIDRVVALLTGQENLRDVIFFPLMKPLY
ncbi:MAG: lysine--tRNA ligase [Planctomycetota bacterium]|nr:MAG: lysine--tRNA ligase [Planctomycetota bacterium]